MPSWKALLVLGSLLLQAQSAPLPTRALGVEWLVVKGRILSRQLPASTYRPHSEFPAFEASFPQGRWGQLTFDGSFLIRALGSPSALELREGFRAGSPRGPEWFWQPPVTIQGTRVSLLTGGRHLALVSLRDSGEKADTATFKLLSVDLITGESRILLSRSDPERRLSAQATLQDGTFVVFLSDGSVHHLEPGSHSLRQTVADAFRRVVPRMIDSERTPAPDSRRIPLPPHLYAAPFFARDGRIYLPLEVRERNTWSESAIRAAFEDMPQEARDRLIQAGKYPPERWQYEGSDYIFLLLAYDPTTHAVTSIPGAQLEPFTSRDRYVEQWRINIVGAGWPSLAEDGQGRIRLLEELIVEGPAPAHPARATTAPQP